VHKPHHHDKVADLGGVTTDLAAWKISSGHIYASSLGTQQIRFGLKTNEITTFSILKEKKRNFGRKLEISQNFG